VDSCERLALVVLCTSWSPWGICWPLYTGEGLDAGISVSEYVVVESCGANDVVVCVFKSEHKDVSGTSRTLDDEKKSDCAGSSLSGSLFIFWLDCGGTLATRRVAIL